MALIFPENSSWQELFDRVIAAAVSDLHISPEAKVHYRTRLSLQPLEELYFSAEDIASALRSYFLTPRQYQQLQSEGSLDFRCTYRRHNFRGNAFSTNLGYALALRQINKDAFPLESYSAHDTLWQMLQAKHGLILICGATGTGKSSTLAAMLEAVNLRLQRHIITLEDPIEYLFTSKASLIQQRELGKDFSSFPQGIKSALRQDPDILMVGEIRDDVTMEATLEAAETGHLVLGTLHAGTVSEAIGRSIYFFPQAEAYTRRQQLAQVLAGVIAQQLISHDESLHCIMEILLPLPAIRNLIRQGKDEQLLTQMQLHQREGMITMEQALLDLRRKLHA